MHRRETSFRLGWCHRLFIHNVRMTNAALLFSSTYTIKATGTSVRMRLRLSTLNSRNIRFPQKATFQLIPSGILPEDILKRHEGCFWKYLRFGSWFIYLI